MKTRASQRNAALVAAAGALLAGCVSTGQHQAALDERDELRERADRLAASVEALTAERDALAGELEDLRQSSDAATREASQRRSDCEARLAAAQAKVDELHATYEGLVKDLEAELASGNSQIEQLREGLRRSLPAELLFASGSTELTGEGERVIREVGKELGADAYASYQVLVEGHTDAAAVRGSLAERFPTNWELAGARAARVVRALEQSGIAPARLAAVSRGAEQPVASNDTAEGRAANRRIEIRLIPLQGARPPQPASPEAPAEGAPPPQAAAP
jgi:chemotaxis protein MotB